MTEYYNHDFLTDKYVQNWLQQISSKVTVKEYKGEFAKWLEWAKLNTEYKTPTGMIESRLKHLTSQNLIERQFWEQTLVKYKNSLETQNLRMATVHSQLRTVMSFFAKNGVKLQFSRGQLKINPSEKDKVDVEWIPSNEEVRLLYRLADSARDRAVLLVLYQSGFSEIDAANMKIETFPFYDSNGNWQISSTEDLYRKQRREKTNQWQYTCISREALEEIRIMLQSRGFPKEGYLFVSFRDKPLEVRGINEALSKLAEKGFNGKAKLWKTKHLRDAFMNGLLQAKLTQELKDSFCGHKREGARNDYAITELTVKTAYAEAFKFLTINGYGSQSRKVEELAKRQEETEKTIMKQQLEIEHQKETVRMYESQLTVMQDQQNQLHGVIDDLKAKLDELIKKQA